MKVIHRSEKLLILEDRPWLLGLFLIAMALIFFFLGMAIVAKGMIFSGLFMGLIGGGLPLLFAALMVRRVRLTFDRQTGQLTRTQRSIRDLVQISHAIGRLVEATVDFNTEGDGVTYRMDLRLQDPPEIVPFTSYYTSGRKPQQMAQVVNDWLAETR